MTEITRILLALALALALAYSHVAEAFSSYPTKNHSSGMVSSFRNRNLSLNSVTDDNKQDIVDSNVALDMNQLEILRQEIEDLKAEALVRVNNLANRVDTIEVVDVSNKNSSGIEISSSSQQIVQDDPLTRSVPVPKSEDITLSTQQDMHTMSSKPNEMLRKPSLNRRENDLLVDTDWRILLSVGREPGTWMPKTWGVSGERLFVSLEVVFSDEQLYEREDFLGSIGDARVLKVLNDEVTLGPGIREGSRTYKVKGGGWRIAKGQGPMGTDLLRFYIECDSEIRHKGGDVYVPAGRIYATCGYFPMNHPRSWEKANLERNLEDIQIRGERKQEEMSKEGTFSLKRFSLYRELVQLKIDAENITSKLNDARVRDPDMSLLREFRKQYVSYCF